MWRRITGCVLTSLCFLSACNKSDNTPPAEPAPTPPVPVPKVVVRPTTAQLATRTPLDLKYVPLTLMVPDGWGTKSYPVGGNPQIFLQGPTPTDLDDIRFRVPTARIIQDYQETKLEADAADMQAKHPDLFGGPVVHSIAGGKVIEQLALRDLPSTTQPIEGMPAPATQLAVTTQPAQSVQWTFTVCIPSGQSFTAYDLTIGMTLAEFKADNAFVRSIMDTLTYSPPVDLPVK